VPFRIYAAASAKPYDNVAILFRPVKRVVVKGSRTVPRRNLENGWRFPTPARNFREPLPSSSIYINAKEVT
jgi:hypothetical protein